MFAEVTKKEMFRLYELIDTKMPENGKCAKQSVTYRITDEEYEVTLTAGHHPRDYNLRELYLGVCYVYSDCMHSYREFKGTYEELKAFLKSGEQAEAFVKDSIRLAGSIEEGDRLQGGIL